MNCLKCKANLPGGDRFCLGHGSLDQLHCSFWTIPFPIEAPDAAKTPYICPVTAMEFVPVSAGKFQMGDVWGDGLDNEKPIRFVAVSAFQMAKYQVTQNQWLKVMGGENPAASSGSRFVGKNKPIINISWDNAKEFINRLNRKSGCGYRLPSEAEWEYAARAGGCHDRYSGTSNVSRLSDFAQYKQVCLGKVGRKRPNNIGLYDMTGNVWEWCEDGWIENYGVARLDGTARGGGLLNQRVYRGGSWGNSSSVCRIAYRVRANRGDCGCHLGFRLSRDGR